MEIYDQIQEAAAYLAAKGFKPAQVGIVLGTGLGQLALAGQGSISVPYDEIPHFPVSTVEFHQGLLVFTFFEGRPVIMMQGRMHHYEGHSMQEVGFPIRVMRALGVQTLFLSGAAGALDLSWKKGDLMLICDHINLQASNPLVGGNDARLGPRFPDMTEAYDIALRALILDAADKTKIELRQGIYVSVPGPMLESPAEYRYLKRIGADAVGMSTVPEVIVAKHSGMRCAGIIVLTDECDPDHLLPINLAEIIKVASAAEQRLIELMQHVFQSI